jgi:hypothetical protein
VPAFPVPVPPGDGLGDDEAGGELVLAVGDGVGEGEFDTGLGGAWAEPVRVLEGAGDDGAVRDGLGRGLPDLVVCEGWPPTRLPTVVPEALWFQTTVCSGLPAAASTTVTAPIATTKITALTAAIFAHPGHPRIWFRHRASALTRAPGPSPRWGDPAGPVSPGSAPAAGVPSWAVAPSAAAPSAAAPSAVAPSAVACWPGSPA